MKYTLSMLFWSNFIFAAPLPSSLQTIEINEKAIVINQEITSSYAERIIEQIQDRQKEKEIIIFINSRGGSQIASMEIVEVIETSKVPVICVAKMAVSGAQSILQSCTKRFGSQFYFGMQHKAYVPKKLKDEALVLIMNENNCNIEQAESIFQEQMKPYIDLDKRRLAKEAKRQKIPFAKFINNLKSEYFWNIDKGLKENNLDGEVKIVCNAKLLETRTCPIYRGEK